MFSISDLFLKADTGNVYTNDKKKSVLDSMPPVLLEKFATFDDNKNNNKDRSAPFAERIPSVYEIDYTRKR